MNDSLLNRVASGDAASVRAVIERYGGLVWSLARRACAHSGDAEDAVQEIFVDLWKSANRFDPALGSEATFVCVVARRRLLDRARSRRRRPTMDQLPDDLVSGTPPPAEILAEASLAKKTLDMLRPEQRRVLSLSIYDGHTHEEIATLTGLPLGTVKAHARRGMIQIRDALAERTEKG